MNNLLRLKFEFKSSGAKGRRGFVQLPKDSQIQATHVQVLIDDLEKIQSFWSRDAKLLQGLIKGILINVHYTRVIAKSNRIDVLFRTAEKESDGTICGARFGKNSQGDLAHVITHFISSKVLDDAIQNLTEAKRILLNHFAGNLSDADFLNKQKNSFPQSDGLSKSTFFHILRESYFIEHFQIPTDRFEAIRPSETRLVSLYKTGRDTQSLLNELGLNVTGNDFLDDLTVYLPEEKLAQLRLKAPALIAMEVTDWSRMPPLQAPESVLPTRDLLIPDPTDEPVVGVIDTLFNPNVYFSRWVSADNSFVKKELRTGEDDYRHGTEVSSIIVDGPHGNPWLDDGCGRLRVKHFGVAPAGHFSSFSILKNIRRIIEANQQIKVWNLSLGSACEVSENFISPEAAELDRLQNEFDVLFVVAGTNKPNGKTSEMRLGAPADSINSVTVNATDKYGNPASYTRTGPILHFFNKPDVSAYGGNGKADRMVVCSHYGGGIRVLGTSFATPWITRKLAYLIYRMGLSREAAKALLIDSAAGWKKLDETCRQKGFGTVPIHIDRVIRSQDDEIRFLIEGTASDYETFTYDIPVPIVKETQPFLARATLCYFPECNRNQGIDYTASELDIHFGRTQDKKGGGSIKTINANRQSDPGHISISEQVARECFRKWDNGKVISDIYKPRQRPRKCLTASGNWGLSIKAKDRYASNRSRGIKFAVVVTLREMNGINRIDTFIKRCQMQGWIVQTLQVESQLKIYEKSEEQIHFQEENKP